MRPSSGQLWPRNDTASVTTRLDGVSSGLSSLGLLAAPITPGTLDTEFNSGSALTTNWSWVNQGGSTAALVDGCLVITGASGSAAEAVRFYGQPIPSASSLSYRYQTRNWLVADDNTTMFCGLALYESTSSKMQLIDVGHFVGGNTYRIGVETYVNPSTFSNHDASWDLTTFQNMRRPYIFECQLSGNTISWRYSYGDGGQMESLFSAAITRSFTTRPDYVGLVTDSTTLSHIAVGVFSWLRDRSQG